ncbi:class II peroxidase [Aplosporella prunicola CBS 121167]|uniref:Peroxidase n=1 Tax=Aplosporella prunicola CBS 121167 TaxID=1176127 RepID=A0A6A6BB14_9PEZI|nr:class II peroxidase [Aplosporella prunicola CBS 121167]KAF2140435.1 class II peroxidase [Aplosporella prunicola CBS 121167]
MHFSRFILAAALGATFVEASSAGHRGPPSDSDDDNTNINSPSGPSDEPSAPSDITSTPFQSSSAPSNPPSLPSNGSCPPVWNDVSSALSAVFLDNGQCSDLARAAIRYAFHDAGAFSMSLPFYPPAAGGADASLLLSPDEISRGENNGLQKYHGFLQHFYAQYRDRGVGAADLIQFAGAHAIATCPSGPVVRALVGRTDATTAAPPGLLPAGFGPNSAQDVLLALFEDKGFSATDLAALIGAHTASRSFTQREIRSGTPQDSTPGQWDVRYYAETYDPPRGVQSFESDINLSSPNTTVGREFAAFVGNQGKWNGAFVAAMEHLSVLGIPQEDVARFVDCTGALPKGTHARNVRAMPINDRAR